MRSARVISALVAFVLTALIPLATAPGSSAAEQAARAIPCVEKAGKHHLCASGKEIGDTNKFVAFGRVSTYKDRQIKVQRRNCGTCAWRFYKKTRTGADRGQFRTRIYPGKRGSKVCYRVVVPRTSKYEVTRLKVGCITTT